MRSPLPAPGAADIPLSPFLGWQSFLLSSHPYKSIAKNTPIELLDHQDLRGQGIHLALDSSDVRAPEQAYRAVAVGSHQRILYTSVTPVALFTTLVPNLAEEEAERSRNPYLCVHTGNIGRHLFTSGEHDAITFRATVDTRTQTIAEVAIFPSSIDIEQLYLRKKFWYWHLDTDLADTGPIQRRGIPYLSRAQARDLGQLTATRRPHHAVEVFNDVALNAAGEYLRRREDVAAILTYQENGEHKRTIEPRDGVRAGVTSAHRTLTHYFNTAQLGKLFTGEEPYDQLTASRIMNGKDKTRYSTEAELRVA